MTDQEPVVAAKKPCLVSLKKGKRYLWCSCGLSKTQPFCDFSHEGTDFKPIKFRAEADEDVLLCACKRTRSGPYCDGAHNNLEDTYAEATAEEIEAMKDSVFVPRSDGETGKAALDGGAYALSPADGNDVSIGTLRCQPVISAKDGAEHLSMHRLIAAPGVSGWLQYADVDTVLFVAKGTGRVDVAGTDFDVVPETGVYVRPGEAFRIKAETEMTLFAAVCPGREDVTRLEAQGAPFQNDFPARTVGIDPEKATVMANRFFQILVDAEIGSAEVTQFIGEVPRSRAAMHRHLYEEAIVILSGVGRMWTGTMCADVKPGDVLFLPHRQVHSVECTSESGMRLIGVFYPSGSPAINY